MSNYHTFTNDEIASDVIENDTQLNQHEGLINNLQTQITSINNNIVSNNTTFTNNINNNTASIVSLNTSQASQNDSLTTLTTAMTNQQTITTTQAQTISDLQALNTTNTNSINGLLGADTTIQGNINTNSANINNLVSLTNGILSASSGSLTIGGAIGGSDNNLFIGEINATTCGIANKDNVGSGTGRHMISQDNNGLIKINDYDIAITSAKDFDNMEANIGNNTTAINSIQTTNTAQGNGIVGNQTNIANNLTAINNNTSSINGILNNSISSVLKSAVDSHTTAITNNNDSINGILNNSVNSVLKSAVDLNTTKNTFPSNLNSLISRGTGYTLEVGSGIGVPRIRLRGQNGVNISSELIFIDATGNNPEYYQGAGLRFNSANNRLEFITDQGNDGVAETAMYIQRLSYPEVYINRLYVPNVLDVMGIDQYPRQNFMYARRIKLVGSATTPNEWSVPSTPSGIIWNNVIINGSLSYDNTTGILNTSATGLFKIKAKISLATTSSQRVMKIGLKVNGGVDVIIGKNHLSRHESNNASFSAPEIDANVRLQSGINYIFYVECLNDGDGFVKNQVYENNDLCIEQLVLPNGYSLPSDYSPV